MQQRIYIETSIPSFYYEDRQDPASIARREWTREWWDNGKHAFEVVTSIAVIEELLDGSYAKQQDCLSFLDEVPLLPVEAEIAEIVENYIVHKLMPADPAGDALRLAIASYYKCDFLLTWNCKHLANANKYQHIKRINTLLGLFVPTLTTPLELLGDVTP